MTLHLHVKYIIIGILSIAVLAGLMAHEAKHVTPKHTSPVVEPVVQPVAHKGPAVSSQAPMQVTPKTVTVQYTPNYHGAVFNNVDRGIDAEAKMHSLVVPEGYVIEQMFLYKYKLFLNRSSTHPSAKRLLVRSSDGLVLAVCYKTP